jgi:aspartate/glutamate racemase
VFEFQQPLIGSAANWDSSGIAQRMKNEDVIEALVLAGTELPLLLRDSATADLEFLDTTVLHVEAIVDELLR